MIVHIATPADWQTAQLKGEYRADSLDSEGFIHYSRPEQAIDTANRYYVGRRDLLLLWVDPQALSAELRWETSHGELYPHLYGPLNLEAVLKVTAFLPNEDGIFRDLPPIPKRDSSSGL